MPSNPDVSVVIPTLNRPEMAVRAARSALGQTHTALEVIVVIDGPDPATSSALSSIDDPRLRVLVLPARGKAPNARNQGVLVAAGRYCMRR